MLIDPDLNEVVYGDRGMLSGMQACLDRQCLVSAVTLMFSTIDALAALTRPLTQDETDGGTFRGWAERFLQPGTSLGVTSIDLWGARCGILHTYSPETTRAARQGARQLFYQWKRGPAAKTQRALPNGAVVVVVETLGDAVRDAADAYLQAISHDADLAKRMKAHLQSLLCYKPYDP
jgi:hypothetical protein